MICIQINTVTVVWPIPVSILNSRVPGSQCHILQIMKPINLQHIEVALNFTPKHVFNLPYGMFNQNAFTENNGAYGLVCQLQPFA